MSIHTIDSNNYKYSANNAFWSCTTFPSTFCLSLFKGHNFFPEVIKGRRKRKKKGRRKEKRKEGWEGKDRKKKGGKKK
jgi:hypothetical protein